MKRVLPFSIGIAALLAVWVLILLTPRPASNQRSRIQSTQATSTPLSSATPSPAGAARVPPPPATNSASGPGIASAPVTNQPAPFIAFADWAERYLAHDPAASVAQGQAHAWKRREAMLELIESDPAKALELAAPFHWRNSLPEPITRYFEQWVDGRGALEVAMAQAASSGKTLVYRRALIRGERFHAFVYGRRLAQPTRANIPLHGIALDHKLALHSDPIRILHPDEAAALPPGRRSDRGCRVCSTPFSSALSGLTAELGGETAWFCGPEHLSMVNDRWQLAEAGGSGAGANLAAGGGSTWTQGRKTLLYMRVNFPDDLTEPISETAAYGVMNSVNTFYVVGSYDTTWLTTTVTPLVTLPQVKGWYATAGPFAVLADAREAARKAGFDTDNFDLDIVSHTTVPGFDWGGLGFVGGKGTWLQSAGAGVTAHELGHNYGLLHANFWDTLTNSSSIIGPGTNREYGNVFDTMGAAAAGNNQFSAQFKNSLGWLPDDVVHDVVTNGVYRLYPFDVPQRVHGRFYGAKVRKDFERDYWLEFRQAFTANASLQNGVLLNWSPWSQSGGGIGLLDTTAGTLDRSDAAVVVGRTFNDFVAGVHLTPVARGMTGTDPWLEVQVNLGSFPQNWPPLVKVEIDPTNATPGQLVHFHATASDVNGDTLAYAWSFDDGGFSTNNLAWTFRSWAQAGAHVVRCVVSDMKGGSASANALVTVGQPSGFLVRGIVIDENQDPVEGVLVTDTNSTGHVSFTDSDGAFILVGLTDDVYIEATKYGYTFTNIGWANPITLVSNVPNAHFRALALTNVSLTLQTNIVIESGGAGQLTLSRTSETTNEFPVNLYVSGDAGVPGDLTFNPPLVAGLNNILIPAGTNRLTFTFAPVNDATVENPETVSVTILDDPAYIIAPAAEARITILDNDQLSPPLVTLAAGSGSIPETGVDSGRFIFSRNGPITGSLPVFYSVSGAATPGVDYPTLAGVAVIGAGQRSVAVEFQPIDDKDVEPDETVIVTLAPDPTYTGGGASATTTIVDDDLLVVTVSPTVSGLSESGASGRFTIKRDGDQTGNLAVYYTMSGTASNGVDYQAPSGAITIPAGQTSADVVITPINDSFVEGDESVVLTLTGNPGYDVGTPGSATLLLRDDEMITVTISAPDVTASEPGSDFGLFTISRGSVVNGNLTVNFVVNGTAINGADYVPLDNFVVIPNGVSSVSLDVIPFDDLHLEPEEDVILTLLPGTNYNRGSPTQARVVMADEDASSVPAVGFTFNTSGAAEDESPGVSVSLSFTSAEPVTVSFRIIGGTASNTDYSLPSPILEFAPGDLAKSLSLTINDDSVVEPDETIRLTLYDPTNATLDGIKIHTYSIVDNDAGAVSVLATANASETGPAPGNFRISRTGSTTNSQLVNFQITGTASSPSDFAPLGYPVTLPPGAAFVDLPVIPVNDGSVELDETVVLTLTTAPGARIGPPNSAALIISDNDPDSLPVVSISSTNKPFAVEGGASGEFLFTRSGPTNAALTLSLAITGTAANINDYAFLSNTLVIPAGQSAVTLPVVPVDDGLIEGEETVIVAVTVQDTYRVAYTASAKVILQDNDQDVRVDASDFEAAEPGTDLGAFTFTRFGTTNTPLQVFFAVSGTASNGIDYATISNSIVIPAGSLAATLPVVPLNDGLVEGPERVTLTLQSNPAYALRTPTVANLTIQDDEPSVSIVARVPTTLEGSPEPGVLTVVRGGDPSYEFTARLAISGTATFGVDYPPILTNVLFTCGVMAVDLLIFPTNELVVENQETVNASLLPDPAYTIFAPSNAVVVIQDAGLFRAPPLTLLSPTASTVFLLGTNVNLILEAAYTDDGDTNTLVTLAWTNISGPESLAFNSTNPLNATVSFTNSGVYVLRLSADENERTNFVDLTVVVDTLGLLADNLLHWPFDDGSGTSVADVSGFGRDGVVQGAANWVTNGALGGALRLSGTNNFVRETVASGPLDGRKQFSLALWARPGSTNSGRGIFSANDAGVDPTLTLATRSSASCGSASNVIEATFASTRGAAQHVSGNNMITNGWQHLALTWSNGLGPSLYINGRLDQPLRGMVPLRGTLTNCPLFLVGKGPLDLGTWDGFVDDVRVFPRALSAAEVEGLVATNYGPVVTVVSNITVQVITPVELSGTVTDDDRPDPPGTVSNTWVQVSGPVAVTLPAPTNLTNVVEFTQAGDYVFRLIAADGQVKVFQDLPVTVVEPTTVYVSTFDPEAAELGPDTGEFTFYRVGDLNFNLTIQVALTGVASNGADYTFIALTNTVTLPAGVDTVSQIVTPFLDDRTEGDETVTYTIVSNLAYAIGSGQATVTIHDSPYGVWNIARFTLEELTDPLLSGPGVDFDHDTYANFVEYSVNRDPKATETNAPLATALEFDPTNGLTHITLTYQRRLEPTDVGYEVRIADDLTGPWHSGPGYVEELSVTDDGNMLTETVKARLIAPWSTSQNQFITVRVWLKQTGP